MTTPTTTTQTPVTRLLEENQIPYRLLPHSKPVFTCEEAANERQVPLAQMAKCLVLVDKKTGKFIMAVASANRRLSMSKLRKELGVKNFDYATPEQISSATGYQKGAIAPVALPPEITVVADEMLMKNPNVNLSAGDPCLGVEVSAWHFRKIFRARIADIAE